MSVIHKERTKREREKKLNILILKQTRKFEQQHKKIQRKEEFPAGKLILHAAQKF